MSTAEPRQTLTISWDRFHGDCRLLSLRLREMPPFAAMVAVARGGLVPAAIVARELSIRAVESVAVASYRGETQQGSALVLKPIAADLIATGGAGLVVVDDLVDTGQTVRLLRSLLPRAHYACVYAKPAGRSLVDTVIADVAQETWIYFPWDLGLTYTVPIVAEQS